MPEPKPTLWFVVPCFGRYALARICLRALRWTCDELDHRGIRADAIIVADDRNLDAARELGFGTVRRANDRLSSRVNDGIAFAGWTRHHDDVDTVDHVVYIGSDNWVDPAWIAAAVPTDRLVCMRSEMIVRADGRARLEINVGYDGGQGVRVTPLQLLQPFAYRPAEERRERAVDGSTLDRLRARHGRKLPIRYVDLHPLQLVGFQSRERQLTSYQALQEDFAVDEVEGDVFETLATVYPAELVDAAEAHYQPMRRRVFA